MIVPTLSSREGGNPRAEALIPPVFFFNNFSKPIALLEDARVEGEDIRKSVAPDRNNLFFVLWFQQNRTWERTENRK
ncbi:MAG: hypothetical protein WCH85_06635, partial [Methanomicrobiales archaeon]